MNKLIVIVSCFFALIIVICSIIYFYPRNGKMLCYYKSSNDVMKTESTYLIKFKNRYVVNLYSKEIIISNDDKMLEQYQNTLELSYLKYNTLDNYYNSVTLNDNELTTITKINYEKLDIDKFISIDNSNKNLFSNKKIKLTKLKKIYTDNGAKCKYIY